MFKDKEKGTMEDFVSKKEKLKRENDELKKLIDETEFEKNDAKALIIAALTTIVPVVLIACLLFYLVIKFIFKF